MKCHKIMTQEEISNIILSVTAWLTCTVIDAAQQLLKALPCNRFSGFQSVAVGLTMQFEILDTEFVQILHCNSGHWVTVSTSGCKPSEVMVYDSLYSGASECIQCQIATLLATPSSHITLHFVDVQMQAGVYDCELFAIAFATALVLGYNPRQYLFDQNSMRRHLWNCLQSPAGLILAEKAVKIGSLDQLWQPKLVSPCQFWSPHENVNLNQSKKLARISHQLSVT